MSRASTSEVNALVHAGCTCARVRRLARRVTQVYDRALAPAGLRVTQFSLLSTLRANDAMPIGRLAIALDMDRTTLTRNLKPLLDAGYVSLDVTQADARTQVAALTRAGRRQLAIAGDAWLNAQREINAVLGGGPRGRRHRAVQGVFLLEGFPAGCTGLSTASWTVSTHRRHERSVERKHMTSVQAKRGYWGILIASAAILMITMGARQTTGLFVSPINTSTGLGIVSISLALAIGQFMWGAAQPAFGAIADKYGASRVVAFGTLLLAAGIAVTPYMKSQLGLILAMGILTAAGAGAGSFSILIGATAQRIPAEKRSFAAGFINAGGSFGQFLFAPLLQVIITTSGWVVAMTTMAVITLLCIPLVWPLRQQRDLLPPGQSGHPSTPAAVVEDKGLKRAVRDALKNRNYLYLHAGFFTCGFHIAFLVTHLPGEVALCSLSPQVAANSIAVIGLFNIAGSLTIGALGARYRFKSLLALMYASRAVLIMAYLLAPKTPTTFYVFAAALGFTWLATIPPTAGLVGRLFGTRYLGTLFGLTLVSHQVGGFLGAYLGGIVKAAQGNYQWMWYADIVLAVAAALINLPIQEEKRTRVLAAA